MPLYEYYCKSCDGIFELLRPVREAGEPQPCPVCDHDSNRIMPTDFNAFVMRGGMPRRIPDQGLYWTLKGQTKEPYKGQKDEELAKQVVKSPKPRNPHTLVDREDHDFVVPTAPPAEARLVKRRGEPLTR